MVRSRSSCSKTKRSFSSITLLVFHGMRLFYTQLPKFCSVRDAPGLICQGCARSVPSLSPTYCGRQNTGTRYMAARTSCHTDSSTPHPQVFWQKRLELIENTGVDFFEEGKERAKRLQSLDSTGLTLYAPRIAV